MADTYQAKLTVTGRNPNDNTLEIYRTAGTDCTELAATYRNQHFWLPTGKNWMTRKWISGEDHSDGFKQCVCVNATIATESKTCFQCGESTTFQVPSTFGVELSGADGYYRDGDREWWFLNSDADINKTYVLNADLGLGGFSCTGTNPDRCQMKGATEVYSSVFSGDKDLDLQIDLYTETIDDQCEAWMTVLLRMQSAKEYGTSTGRDSFWYETGHVVVASVADLEQFLLEEYTIATSCSSTQSGSETRSPDYAEPQVRIFPA